jgi:surfactin family lipopeptide synthetase A/fengycin family lipopeptide synthetase D
MAGASGLHQLWEAVVHHLERQKESRSLALIRGKIPPGWAEAIPNFERLGVRESIYYLNVIRTFDRARNGYLPGGKVRAPVHFFSAAAEEIGDREEWSRFSAGPVTYRRIEGDHFSIFRSPQVEAFAELFSRLCRF